LRSAWLWHLCRVNGICYKHRRKFITIREEGDAARRSYLPKIEACPACVEERLVDRYLRAHAEEENSEAFRQRLLDEINRL
jgi:hypothetical protein